VWRGAGPDGRIVPLPGISPAYGIASLPSVYEYSRFNCFAAVRPPRPIARRCRPALSTLVDIARWRAECQPHDVAFTFLLDGQQQEAHLSYCELDRRARALAAELVAHRARGQRVLVVFDPGLEYNAAIFGCLYAGAIAVPVYPPDPFRAYTTLAPIAVDTVRRPIATGTCFGRNGTLGC